MRLKSILCFKSLNKAILFRTKCKQACVDNIFTQTYGGSQILHSCIENDNIRHISNVIRRTCDTFQRSLLVERKSLTLLLIGLLCRKKFLMGFKSLSNPHFDNKLSMIIIIPFLTDLFFNFGFKSSFFLLSILQLYFSFFLSFVLILTLLHTHTDYMPVMTMVYY